MAKLSSMTIENDSASNAHRSFSTTLLAPDYLRSEDDSGTGQAYGFWEHFLENHSNVQSSTIDVRKPDVCFIENQ